MDSEVLIFRCDMLSLLFMCLRSVRYIDSSCSFSHELPLQNIGMKTDFRDENGFDSVITLVGNLAQAAREAVLLFL